MADVGDMIFGIVSVILEGIVLAVVLKFWEDWVTAKKENKEISWLMKNFLKDVTRGAGEPLYFLVKFASSESKNKLQQILGMELGDPKVHDDENAISMKNSEYNLILSSNQDICVVFQGEFACYFSNIQDENKKILDAFVTYCSIKCSSYGIKI